ncbi:MAG: saccharopine dehydrogenase family protein [Bacteroidaceae bacterium]|nr:saccharopine dehydrogenase family protein [Bacteroidaceae bacterium]MDD7526535.1 saccharopine dehydrogenase family protein [Prevotellaceae bacterium]MDY5761381.1 saccharopine dehydrogenase family protein [Bacteroidaceae bacterium]
MGRVLIIGAGGVASVAAHKVAQNSDVFTDIMIASRTESKCKVLAKAIEDKGLVPKGSIKTAHVDADNVPELVALFNEFKPDLVMNLALPYQDLTIMEACLQSGVSYLDTANYEPKDEAHFEYSWQWAFKERFEQAGLTAILGCGFDPGVTSIYTAYAAKHHFDEIQYLDIVDCNAGDHHKAFATNFNPEINIREITQKGLYWENGQWVETEPLEIHKPLNYPEIGPKESYLLHHEEIESLVKNYPTIKRARFWMTFGEQYLKHLDVIQNIGMSRIDEIEYTAEAADGSGPVKVKIVPLQFLKAVLPNPQELGENYEGQTSIGCRIRGIKDGKERTYYVYNNCSHRAAYEETGMQGVSYTTGVPAMIGAMMFMKGIWKRPGVWNVEEFDPDPFMEQLNKQGLPWHEVFDGDLEL